MVSDRTAADAGYFNWLCKRVWTPDPAEGRTYDALLIQMYETEFVWVIGNDENRIADARELRRKYDGRPVASHKPISFLEVLIALSERFAFMVGKPAKDLAWELMVNLRLNQYPDPIGGTDWNAIRNILECVIWRTYGANGRGGFFPLEYHPQDDQTTVEIWYQMAAYINERRESFDL